MTIKGWDSNMDELQEKMNKLYEQKKAQKKTKHFIKNVILTQKEVEQLNKTKKDFIIL